MEQHHGNGITDEQVPLLQPTNPLNDGDSMAFLHRACDAITAFLTFLGIWSTIFFTYTAQWLIVILTFIFGLFFIIPLTPDFTLHSISTSASILNTTTATQNLFTTNLGFELHVDHSNPIGSTIHYSDDSLHASLFHRQEMISTFSHRLQQEQSNTAAIEALFSNVTLVVDEWSTIMDHGFPPSSSCGYVYLDLWFNASARFTPFAAKDKLEGHCGEVKVQLCSSSSPSVTATTVVHPFHVSCDVQSDVVRKTRPVVLEMVIFFAVIVLVIHLLMGHFMCCSPFFQS